MISHGQFLERSSFSRDDLLALAHGTLLADPPAGFACRLPLPPMLMFDRIVSIGRSGMRGRIVAERDLRIDDFFFQCHFRGDPVQPGCLGVDAVWQLLGFFCAWAGAVGSGRALGCGEVAFDGQIRPHDELVRYEIEVRRFSNLVDTGAAVAIGDATVHVDGQCVYTIKKAKVGVFRDIAYDDYPWPGANARGGRATTGGLP